MAQIPESVLNAAIALSPETRAALAEELWLSVDEKGRKQIEAAWSDEIDRRVTQLESGDAELIPGEQVMREARELLDQ